MTSPPSGVCCWLKKGWGPVDVFITGWRQEGHPATKTLHQLHRLEYTFPALLLLHHHTVWEWRGEMVGTLDPRYNAVIRHRRPYRVIARTALYWNESCFLSRGHIISSQFIEHHHSTWSDCLLMTAGLLCSPYVLYSRSIRCQHRVPCWAIWLSIP